MSWKAAVGLTFGGIRPLLQRTAPLSSRSKNSVVINILSFCINYFKKIIFNNYNYHISSDSLICSRAAGTSIAITSKYKFGYNDISELEK